MGQVPPRSYLMIGDGRLAGHLSHYFDLEQIPHRRWHRRGGTPVGDALQGASHVLLLISDDAIESFIRRHRRHAAPIWIHCSGSLDTDMAVGVHPF